MLDNELELVLERWDAAVSDSRRYLSRTRPWLSELMSAGDALRATVANTARHEPREQEHFERTVEDEP